MKIGRRFGKLTMAIHKNSSQRSAFAESAYAHAENRRRRHQRSDEDQSNVVHAEFQPLTGAIFYVGLLNEC